MALETPFRRILGAYIQKMIRHDMRNGILYTSNIVILYSGNIGEVESVIIE